MKEHINLIDYLDNEWKTTSQLSKETGLSEKTIRNRIKKLNEKLRESGAFIESKTNRGFRMIISDDTSFNNWEKKTYLNTRIHPDDHKARCLYILSKLLFEHRNIKRSELADDLYVSEKTISNDMKDVQNILLDYELEVKAVPNYGYHVIGNEFNIRQCLLNCVISPMDKKDLHVQKVITKIIHDVISTNGMSIPDYLIQAIIDYLAITTKRIREGIFIHDENANEWDKHIGIYYVSIYIMESMVTEGLIQSFNDEEVFYVSLYLWGNRILRQQTSGVKSYVIPTHIVRITAEMERILKTKYNLSLDEEYRHCLTIHTVTAEIRGKYNIMISNPSKNAVKEEYPYAYYLSEQIAKPLEAYLNKMLSDDEISFYAMLMQGLIPDKDDRLSVVFVYDAERVEDHAILKRIEMYLGDIVSIDYKCEPGGLDRIDESTYDVILTTQPVSDSIEKKVFTIEYSDIISSYECFRKNLEEIRNSYWKAYLEKRIHLTIRNGKVIDLNKERR